MKYTFREVVCPFCEHRFMYNQNGREIIFYEYRDKKTESITLIQFALNAMKK